MGHALQPTPDLVGDRFGALPAQAKDDIAAWVLAQPAVPAPASLPRTGDDDTWPAVAALLLLAALTLTAGLWLRQRSRA